VCVCTCAYVSVPVWLCLCLCVCVCGCVCGFEWTGVGGVAGHLFVRGPVWLLCPLMRKMLFVGLLVPCVRLCVFLCGGGEEA
jgi:F0F1-type ATP synthase membrane subunit a